MAQEKPYGSWQSPISPSDLTKGNLRISDVKVEKNNLYWIETRPSEQGRSTIVSYNLIEQTLEEKLPKEYSSKSRVHEYGGASFVPTSHGIYFVQENNQQIHLLKEGHVQQITFESHMRYADLVYDPTRHFLFAIEEDHQDNKKVLNRLVTICCDTGKRMLIHEGWDFYASPTLEKNGEKLAFLTWSLPNMPWDGTTLWETELNSQGKVEKTIKIAGSDTESIFQPCYGPDHRLYYISDKTGYWNLYVRDDGYTECLYEKEVEFGYPQWKFGYTRYDFAFKNGKLNIICIYTDKGVDFLGLLDIERRFLTPIHLPNTTYFFLQAYGDGCVFLAGSSSSPLALRYYDLKKKKVVSIKSSLPSLPDPGYLSHGTMISFQTTHQKEAYAFYYPPKNKKYRAPQGELPPLIVLSHGGPSGHSNLILNLEYAFWTSRGFAILDVNYGGSTGYGREYRERLRENWGITDVEDCLSAAKYLVQKQRADPKRLIIKGRSAGGYTTLAALTFHDLFQIGVSHYGVCDLEELVKETHKFESCYLEFLIGHYPKRRNLYLMRSPIHHLEKLSSAMLLLQGKEDPVVPCSQAEKMYQAVKDKGLPVAYLLFEGEAHGFKKAQTIEKALEAELYFYSKIFDFKISDTVKKIPIDNLKD